MHGLIRLHDLAATRGDGLRPEMLALLAARSAAESHGVEDIARHRGFAQAGPHPVHAIEGPLPDSVLRFPQSRPTAGEARTPETRGSQCISR